MIHLPYVGQHAITRRFGSYRDQYARFGTPGAPLNGHNGIDVAMAYRDPLLAVADGVMGEVRKDPTGYGNYGVLVDGAGTEWMYGHADRWHVKEGAMVTAGQHIADANSSGNSTGHHLHFGKRPKGYNRGDGYLGYVNPRHDLPIPFRVLLQAGHYPNAGGAPGEAEWTMRLAMKVATILRQYITCEIVGDFYGKTPPAETHHDWDAFIAFHYDAYQPPAYTSGCSAARGEYETEYWEADRLKNLWLSKYPTTVGIPLAMQRVGPNMTQYYGFRPLTAVTPGIILEHGCGQGDDKAALWDGIGIVAATDAAIILSYLGVETGGTKPDPVPVPPFGRSRTVAERAFDDAQLTAVQAAIWGPWWSQNPEFAGFGLPRAWRAAMVSGFDLGAPIGEPQKINGDNNLQFQRCERGTLFWNGKVSPETGGRISWNG